MFWTKKTLDQIVTEARKDFDKKAQAIQQAIATMHERHGAAKTEQEKKDVRAAMQSNLDLLQKWQGEFTAIQNACDALRKMIAEGGG